MNEQRLADALIALFKQDPESYDNPLSFALALMDELSLIASIEALDDGNYAVHVNGEETRFIPAGHVVTFGLDVNPRRMLMEQLRRDQRDTS